MGKSHSKSNTLKKVRRKNFETKHNYERTSPKGHIPQKYWDPRSSPSFNSSINRSSSHDVSGDTWIHRVVTPSSANID
jgi:hypothetical protein